MSYLPVVPRLLGSGKGDENLLSVCQKIFIILMAFVKGSTIIQAVYERETMRISAHQGLISQGGYFLSPSLKKQKYFKHPYLCQASLS